jgi:hypothetical protein
MAFINIVLERFTDGGMCWEHGTWEMTAGTTYGTIYPATLGQGITGGIRRIYNNSFWSDADHELAQYLPANQSYVKVTDALAASGTHGRYTLIGKMA